MRPEIGGSYLGIPQNDLGIRTDLLDCCPKAEGMLMLHPFHGAGGGGGG